MKTLIVGAVLAAATIASTAPADSATKPDVIVGTNAAAAYWFNQTTGDCMLAAFDFVYGTIKGSRMKEVTVELEAVKLDVAFLADDHGHLGISGSNWFGANGITKLAAHYGIKMTVGSHTIQTIETDLAAGDHIIAFVDSHMLETSIPAFNAWGTAPEGGADHAVVVDSINETQGTVTVTDSGWPGGRLETTSLAAFRAAMVQSGYSYAITSKAGK